MSAGHVDPGKDVAFFEQVSKELRSFARAFERGTHSTSPVPDLSAVIERLELLKPLDEFRRVAQLSAKAAGPLGVKEDELYAQWRLAFFERQTEKEELLAHAAKITTASVSALAKRVQDEQTLARRSLQEMNATSELTPHYETLSGKHGAAAKAARRANEALMHLIGAPDTPFDPKHRYVEDWKKEVGVSEALAGVSRRGLDPDGETIKAMRAARGWTQADLVDGVRERTGIKLGVRTIRRVEAGRRVDVKTIRAIAEAFDEDPAALAL